MEDFLIQYLYRLMGGGENVARVVLAMCELIVSRGLTKKIIVSRLPVGT